MTFIALILILAGHDHWAIFFLVLSMLTVKSTMTVG